MKKPATCFLEEKHRREREQQLQTLRCFLSPNLPWEEHGGRGGWKGGNKVVERLEVTGTRSCGVGSYKGPWHSC